MKIFEASASIMLPVNEFDLVLTTSDMILPESIREIKRMWLTLYVC